MFEEVALWGRWEIIEQKVKERQREEYLSELHGQNTNVKRQRAKGLVPTIIRRRKMSCFSEETLAYSDPFATPRHSANHHILCKFFFSIQSHFYSTCGTRVHTHSLFRMISHRNLSLSLTVWSAPSPTKKWFRIQNGFCCRTRMHSSLLRLCLLPSLEFVHGYPPL